MDFLLDYENKKEIREYEYIIAQVEKEYRGLRELSDTSLKDKTREFKERISSGESLDEILPEAFAVVRESSRRYLGIEQYPSQMMGAIALHRGDVAQMKTGEGKTYTAPMAAYLNALTEKSVHIATSNDALATRDRNLIAPVLEGLGLTVGVVTEERDSDSKKDIEKRKEAYACDITYGSSNAFAFDYLRDNTTYNKEHVVRNREVGFAIIDEADQILVNDAVMPFKLSGTLTNPNESSIEKLVRREKEKKESEELLELANSANSFVHKLYKDKEHIKGLKTEEQMSIYTGGNKETTRRANRLYSVLYTESSAATLTERGWLEAFKYFEGTRIQKIVERNTPSILENPFFEQGVDYEAEEGELHLTLRGLDKAIKEFDELRQLNNLFYSSSEFNGLNKAIDNALRAYFVLSNGKEYILNDVKGNYRGGPKKKVLLVSNGRTAEGRVYSDGLQQAIELKERRLHERERIQIEMTEEHSELASISQKAFYSIYPKIAGMTGTSAKELFQEVYGMDTIEIPKNSEYRVSEEDIDRIYQSRVDNDTVLFETDKEKMEAVIASVLESREKGQPILIGTTSVTESNLLYEEFQKRGIPCEKLNAENAKIEFENEIISKAGRRGSVTISTQLAGRGTDIKLGGNLEDMIEEVEQEKIDMTVKNVIAMKNITSEEGKRQAQIYVTKRIEEQKMDEIRREAEERLSKEREELIEAGGLKVIGYGHFNTKRDDEQLKGRAARQADPGVTEFYTSVKDLRQNLLVPNDKIRMLHKKGLKEDSPLSGLTVEKVISSAQSNIEYAMTSVISNTQEEDFHLSKMRKKIYDQRNRMLQGENPEENMEYIISSSVVNIIDKNLPEWSKDVSPRKKIGKSGLNLHNFAIDVEETFGIDLTSALEEGRLTRLRDLQEYISDEAIEKYHEIRKENGAEQQDVIDRNNIIGTIDSAWLMFNENLDYIRFQHSLNNLVQNKDYDEILAMKKGFNQAMVDSKIEVVSKMMGKPSNKKRTNLQEEDSLEVDNTLNDYYEESKSKNHFSNVNVRASKVMTTLTDKIKLIKNKIKYQFELVYEDDVVKEESQRVETMDFNNVNAFSYEYSPIPQSFEGNVGHAKK